MSSASTDIIFGTTIRNPLFPYTHFQYRPDTQRVVCLFFSDVFETKVEEAMKQLTLELSLTTPRVSDWLTTSFLELHKSDLPKLYVVIQRLLQLVPFSCTIKDQTNVRFFQQDKDTPLTRLVQETKYIQDLKDGLQWVKINQIPIYRDVFWRTQEGFAMAKILRDKFYLSNEYDAEESTTGEELEKAFEALPKEAQDKKESDILVNEDEKTDLCCICFKSPPETQVYPCLHKVACIACSKDMETKPTMAHTCIICRGTITRIEIELD